MFFKCFQTSGSKLADGHTRRVFGAPDVETEASAEQSGFHFTVGSYLPG